jgi:gamma-glutamyltranspeptidase / glutathione hydrolase
MKKLKTKVSILILISTLTLFFTFAFSFSHATEVKSKNGMVVAAHPIASKFGLEILKFGGNAVDAAVGTALIIGVVEPHASGLGGGGGMLIYLHDLDSLTYINYYARAPRLVATNFFSPVESKTAAAVLVPGTVAGLHHALQKYGTISWKDLLLKVIQQIKTGFLVDDIFYKIMLDSYESLLKYSQTKSIYLKDDLPPEVNQRIINNRIISTLKKLANDGPDVFYHGEIADSIEATMIRLGGGLRKSDLTTYRPIELNPVQGTYRGHTIYSAPPPQSGITIIEILNILEFNNLSLMGNFNRSVSTFHFMAEAMKRAYADRIEYQSDPKFFDIPKNILLSKEFARSRFNTINMQQASPINPKETLPGDIKPFLFQPDAEPKNKDGSTTHISVVDVNGNAVSLTQTLNHFWGSGISVCGFLLNNGMTAFSRTSTANNIQSNRQPRSTISPSMLFQNKYLQMVIGSPGAGRIISTIVEVICNMIDFNKSANQANEAPRFCSRKWSDTLPVEDRFPPTMLDSLKSMGHEIEVLDEMDLYFGGVQLIIVDKKHKLLIGSSDPRRSGAALGY